MAQPATSRIQHLGAVNVVANQDYTASQFKSSFPNADIFILKTKTTPSVRVSINDTVAFPIEYNEISAFDGSTSLTYTFTQNCIIAFGQEIPLA